MFKSSWRKIGKTQLGFSAGLKKNSQIKICADLFYSKSTIHVWRNKKLSFKVIPTLLLHLTFFFMLKSHLGDFRNWEQFFREHLNVVQQERETSRRI